MSRRKQKSPCKVFDAPQTKKRKRYASKIKVNGPEVEWSKEERECLLQALQEDNGENNWKAIKKRIGTRDVKQTTADCDSFHQEVKNCMEEIRQMLISLRDDLRKRDQTMLRILAILEHLHVPVTSSSTQVHDRTPKPDLAVTTPSPTISKPEQLTSTTTCYSPLINPEPMADTHPERPLIPQPSSRDTSLTTPSSPVSKPEQLTSTTTTTCYSPLINPDPMAAIATEEPVIPQPSSRVAVGGFKDVLMDKCLYAEATNARKPSKCALMILDATVPRNILVKSTVNGTKDWLPINKNIMAAIKAEVLRLFSYRCRNQDDIDRMWETVKISMGKRCQNLRRKFDLAVTTPSPPISKPEQQTSATCYSPLINAEPTEATAAEQSPIPQSSSLVAVGGLKDVLMDQCLYAEATYALRPSKCALMILDATVPINILAKSTVTGTKDWLPINANIMAAIKAEVLRLFSYRCRNQDEIERMWEAVKISIGKRCQHLRSKKRAKEQSSIEMK